MINFPVINGNRAFETSLSPPPLSEERFIRNLAMSSPLTIRPDAGSIMHIESLWVGTGGAGGTYGPSWVELLISDNQSNVRYDTQMTAAERGTVGDLTLIPGLGASRVEVYDPSIPVLTRTETNSIIEWIQPTWKLVITPVLQPGMVARMVLTYRTVYL